MAVVQGILTTVQAPLDINAVYGYPAGTKVLVHQDKDGEVHDIVGTDADPSTNFANAPNGSTYRPLTATAGSMKLWIKFGATFGAKDGSWKASSALS